MPSDISPSSFGSLSCRSSTSGSTSWCSSNHADSLDMGCLCRLRARICVDCFSQSGSGQEGVEFEVIRIRHRAPGTHRHHGVDGCACKGYAGSRVSISPSLDRLCIDRMDDDRRVRWQPPGYLIDIGVPSHPQRSRTAIAQIASRIGNHLPLKLWLLVDVEMADLLVASRSRYFSAARGSRCRVSSGSAPPVLWRK